MRIVLPLLAVIGSALLPSAVEAQASSPAEAQPSYAFPPDAAQMTIVGLPEFPAHIPDADGFSLWLTSRHRDNPTASTFRLWGLTITDHAAVRRLLQDRAVRCLQVTFYRGIAYLDCDAAPEPGRSWVTRYPGEEWINLLTWLPELGFAVRECGEAEPATQRVVMAGDVGYFCRDGEPRRSWIIREEVLMPPEDEAGPSAGLRNALIQVIQGCWNRGALSAEAAQTSVTVSFELGDDGRVAGDVALISDDAASHDAAQSAFEAARRAILRCQGEGYALPREVRLTFDPAAGGSIR